MDEEYGSSKVLQILGFSLIHQLTVPGQDLPFISVYTDASNFISPNPYLSNNHLHSQTSWPDPHHWACLCQGPACQARQGSPGCHGAKM